MTTSSADVMATSPTSSSSSFTYTPSPSSLSFRTNLANLISPLRRVRPRVPFFQLAAHRIPTLWGLYRGLLREAPSDHIKFRVRMVFRRKKGLTGTAETKKYLERGYKFLDAFKRANAGDAKQQAVLARYTSLLHTHTQKAYWLGLASAERAWQTQLANRPIVTGAYLRASEFNRILPRLSPQPDAISGMIRKRIRAKARWVDRGRHVAEVMRDLANERAFERGVRETCRPADLVRMGPPVFEDFGWFAPLRKERAQIHAHLTRLRHLRHARAPRRLRTLIQAARREKVLNKTREKERERRGEVLAHTLRQQRRRPPAHVSCRMSPRRRRWDEVSRRPGEVGYVAQVKMKLGFRLKDPEAWKAEGGPEEDREALERRLQELERENEQRRQSWKKQLTAE